MVDMSCSLCACSPRAVEWQVRQRSCRSTSSLADAAWQQFERKWLRSETSERRRRRRTTAERSHDESDHRRRRNGRRRSGETRLRSDCVLWTCNCDSTDTATPEWEARPTWLQSVSSSATCYAQPLHSEDELWRSICDRKKNETTFLFCSIFYIRTCHFYHIIHILLFYECKIITVKSFKSFTNVTNTSGNNNSANHFQTIVTHNLFCTYKAAVEILFVIHCEWSTRCTQNFRSFSDIFF